MVVQSLIALPMLSAEIPPVLVHNLLLFAAIVASAVGMFALVERLTHNRAAALIAGIIFAFAPYRFEHYMHMELQWTVWMPWALWAAHRTIESGRWQHGLQTGLFVALQMLSSVYYGVFLATILPIVSGLLMLTVRRPQAFRALKAFGVGAAAALVVCSIYALPYRAAARQVGPRPPEHVSKFSAQPSDYLVATPDNRIYGGLFDSQGERRLFPGLLALLLALTGLLMRRPTVTILVYLLAMVVAFEMSLGMHGYMYRFLYEHVPLFAGLRAPARLGIFVVMFLAVLAANGYSALHDAATARMRRVLAIGISCLLLLEYAVTPLHLVPYDNSAPQVYTFLKWLPPGVVAEFPVPPKNVIPGPDARYTYMSTFHWKPLINGYSGYHPRSYLGRIEHLRSFPDDESLDVLRRADVAYVVVHLSEYPSENKMLLALQSYPDLELLGMLKDGRGQAVVCRLTSH
jgi:hypothetical protein